MLTGILSDAGAETLAVTASGGWREGDRVNLERSHCVGDELGGHLVSDHVDGVADILEIDQMARYAARLIKAVGRDRAPTAR